MGPESLRDVITPVSVPEDLIYTEHDIETLPTNNKSGRITPYTLCTILSISIVSNSVRVLRKAKQVIVDFALDREHNACDRRARRISAITPQRRHRLMPAPPMESIQTAAGNTRLSHNLRRLGAGASDEL